jgi:hypothetical protein
MRTVDVIMAANDATTLAAALMPLIQAAVAGNEAEISDELVAAARDRLNRNIDALDKLIADAQAKPPATA